MQHDPPASPTPEPLTTTRKRVILLSVLSFLVMITYSSFSSVLVYLHQKYRHKGYGQAYLTANAFAAIIAYIFCPFVLERSSLRSTTLLFVCVVGYLMNLLIPTFFSLLEENYPEGDSMPEPSSLRFSAQIVANLLGGAASSLFGILTGLYICQYCRGVPQNQKGKIIGLANLITNSRLVLAPIITILGLGMGSETVYFFLLSCIAACALPIPLLWIPQIQIKQNNKQLANQSQSLSQLDKDPQQQKQKSVFAYVITFIKYFKQVRFLLPASLLAGLLMGFVSSSLAHLLPRPRLGQNNDTNVAICLVFFGLGNLISGYLSAYLCDRLGIRKSCYIGHSLVIATSLVQAICLSLEPTLGSATLVGFLSGLSYSYMFSLVFIICTIQLKGASLSNSTNRQATSLSYILYQWVVAFLNNRCNMQLNMTYQGLLLIPLALLSMYAVTVQGAKGSTVSEDYFAKETNLDARKSQQN